MLRSPISLQIDYARIVKSLFVFFFFFSARTSPFAGRIDLISECNASKLERLVFIFWLYIYIPNIWQFFHKNNFAPRAVPNRQIERSLRSFNALASFSSFFFFFSVFRRAAIILRSSVAGTRTFGISVAPIARSRASRKTVRAIALLAIRDNHRTDTPLSDSSESYTRRSVTLALYLRRKPWQKTET